MSEAMELLETACDLISSAGPGSWDDLPQAWRDAAEKWRERYLALVKDAGEAEGAPLPEGEYARVEIMGHDYATGWVSDGTRAGVPVLVIRNHDGRVIREVPGHALFSYFPLPTPLRRPEPRPALGAAVGTWDSPEDDGYDDRDDEGGPF